MRWLTWIVALTMGTQALAQQPMMPMQSPPQEQQQPQGFKRRIKDLTNVEGDRPNVITGLGLVTGLNGTGGLIPPTREFLVSLMQRFGRPVDPVVRAALRNDNRLTTDSMSVVLVTAYLDSTTPIDSRIQVSVAALDGATDINNGILANTPLLGVDQQVYALAAGRVNTGGIVAVGEAASVQKNHPTTGTALAIVERRVPRQRGHRSNVRLLLRNPDEETAIRIRDAINAKFDDAARAIEKGIVHVTIPPRYFSDRLGFISEVQKQRVVPDSKALVVINSQTGTVVVNDRVTISRAAVTHGNISVVTGESPLVSQPLPFSQGETAVVPRTEIDVVEDVNPLTVIGETTTVTELAETLNMLGVSPQDLSSIFRQLDTAGVLQADLIIK